MTALPAPIDPADPDHARQSVRFLLLYALAWAGGAVAYVPFLTLLLPIRVADMAGMEAISWLGYLSFAGAIAASAGGIFFGWLSDITRTRNAWIWIGLAINTTLLVTMGSIDAPLPLAIALVVWQLGLNMMLGPLAALGGDFTPDRQKGLLGGLMAFAPAAGAAAGAIITIPGLVSAEGRYMMVAAMVALCVVPLLLFGRPTPFAWLMKSAPVDSLTSSTPDRAIVRMWVARLALQLSEAALFAYLLYYFQSIAPEISDSDIARIFSLLLIAAIPLALLAGQWSDRNDRAIVPLRLCAGLSALGLALMAISTGFAGAVAGYILFGLATTVFLSLHSSQILRVLPRPSRRGRDLGVFNLTNTAPSLIVPWLAIAIVPNLGFTPLLWLLAGLAALGCLLMVTIRALPKAT